jgi:hypothetical protein
MSERIFFYVIVLFTVSNEEFADKIKFYQNWLRDFSRRRIEDADFAMKAARTLSNIEMKPSMGLVEKEDLQTAKVA